MATGLPIGPFRAITDFVQSTGLALAQFLTDRVFQSFFACINGMSSRFQCVLAV